MLITSLLWEHQRNTRLVDSIKDGVKNVITESTNPSAKLLSSQLVK